MFGLYLWEKLKSTKKVNANLDEADTRGRQWPVPVARWLECVLRRRISLRRKGESVVRIGNAKRYWKQDASSSGARTWNTVVAVSQLAPKNVLSPKPDDLVLHLDCSWLLVRLPFKKIRRCRQTSSFVKKRLQQKLPAVASCTARVAGRMGRFGTLRNYRSRCWRPRRKLPGWSCQ